MSTSCESLDMVDRWESPRLSSPLLGRLVWLCWGVEGPVKGEAGRGRWPERPPKLSLVGVLGEDSSLAMGA